LFFVERLYRIRIWHKSFALVAMYVRYTLCSLFKPSSEPSLFIDGETIPSREGTTQGDPVAMAMYAIGILPLILHLQEEADQLRYADDSSAGGTIKNLRGWWDKLQKLGPNYGYFTHPQKSVLVVKEHRLAEAEAAFEGTGIQVSSLGGRYLGCNTFKEAFVENKVKQWTSKLEHLADIVASQPHAAYAALNFSIKHRWFFPVRTTKDTSASLQPVEDAIRHKVLPALTGKQAISNAERKPFALPIKLRGLGISILPDAASHEISNSIAVTEPPGEVHPEAERREWF